MPARFLAWYWQGLMSKGTAPFSRRLRTPKGAWGIGIVRVKDAGELAALLREDPVALNGKGFVRESLPLSNLRFEPKCSFRRALGNACSPALSNRKCPCLHLP